jgi:hypothetical protein
MAASSPSNYYYSEKGFLENSIRLKSSLINSEIIAAITEQETIAPSPATAAICSHRYSTKIEKKKPKAYEVISKNPVVTVSS